MRIYVRRRTRLPSAHLWRRPLLWMGMCVGVDPGIPRCKHSGDNGFDVSNDKAWICALWEYPIVVVAQRPIDCRLAAGHLCNSTRSVCVCVCWHAGPTPHSLLQNLHLCVFPAVSLPASSALVNALPSQRRAVAMVDCWKSCIINLAEAPSVPRALGASA